ncbi:16434_t:CDS:2, partial [Racocetra persica]
VSQEGMTKGVEIVIQEVMIEEVEIVTQEVMTKDISQEGITEGVEIVIQEIMIERVDSHLKSYVRSRDSRNNQKRCRDKRDRRIYNSESNKDIQKLFQNFINQDLELDNISQNRLRVQDQSSQSQSKTQQP